MIAWDTETRSLRWWENPAFLWSWDTGGGGAVAVLPEHAEGRNVAAFERAVTDDRHHVGANLKFDAHMGRAALRREVVFRPGNRWDDVLMLSRLLFGNRRPAGHNLKDLATDFIDPAAKDAEAAMQACYKELTGRSDMAHDDAYYATWKASPKEVERYAVLDAEYTRKLYDVLMPQLKADAKLLSLYEDVELPVMQVLYEAEKEGVHVNPKAVTRLERLYEARDHEARRTLESALGFVPEGEGSEEALRRALVDAGVPLTERTEKTEEYAVNRAALEKHANHPAVAALFDWRRAEKFLKTYLAPLRDKDHIHPTFNQAEAWTGRMSGRDPNMQNLPKRTEIADSEDEKIRSVFVPSPGYEFIIADYESIEVFVLAHFLGSPEYKELVKNGDPHARTAAVIWPHVSPTWEGFQKNTPNRWLRDIAKHITYAIVYGGGGRVIANTINKFVSAAGHLEFMVDEDQARAIRRKVTDNIPGFKSLTETPWRGKQYPQGRIYKQLHESIVTEESGTSFGYVRTLMGRKQWIQVHPDDKSYVGLSGLIQGSAADIMKLAAINTFEALKPYGGRPILFVHDEIVAEVPYGWGERLKPIMAAAMEQAAAIDPPVKVEAHVTTRSYAHVD